MAGTKNLKNRRVVVGIVAHVDAGKTTLTEGILYSCSKLRTLGRVDHKDSFLDNNEIERARGITVYSKPACFTLGDTEFTLIDTPGHADFAPETERCLKALDVAVLVISGTEGIQAHTRTLWKLIDHYKLPCLVFVNKMDRALTDRSEIMRDLKKDLSSGMVDFTASGEEFYEAVAENDEALTAKFLEGRKILDREISELVAKRLVYPVYFGSALKTDGISAFLDGLTRFTPVPERSLDFGAYVYKIRYDEKGERLTFAKITGGSVSPRDSIVHRGEDGTEEKVSLIRLYDGAKFEGVQKAEAGMVVALTGLKDTKAGEGLGSCENGIPPVLVPVLSRKLILPSGVDVSTALPVMKMIEEENPEISVTWNEKLKEIELGTMGDIQDEILKNRIRERLGADVELSEGSVLYKETITGPVEGVGHFEPLRHYAEVHLLLEPGPRGSGITAESICSEDILDRNWQRLILTHVFERTHKGVLTGAPLTDVSIKLVRGRAHKKHTVGGDFRQAVYRAIRQGLMQADSVLLEPYYDFRLEIPQESLGRAMTDVERLYGKCSEPLIEGGRAVLLGSGPVSTFREYASEVTAYTRGLGNISFTFKGYDICHNGAEVKAVSGYDPLSDIKNPASSVFCANGAGFVVEWDQVRDYMHQEGIWFEDEEPERDAALRVSRTVSTEFVGVEEVDAIIAKAAGSNKREDPKPKNRSDKDRLPELRKYKAQPAKEPYILVDGYNLLFADSELSELAKADLHAARNKLVERISNYAGAVGQRITVVFDAYRVENHPAETVRVNTIDVVFTKTAETADRYIERLAHLKASEFDICVVTSDMTEQVIILGAGCRRMFSADFYAEMAAKEEALRERYGVSE
ncbi:MAG: NYN domain-containing protein [Lachnospiraceae bacterium]|nr:NYN domain-containing protein [Lachnospiraceae bacterium]